MTESMLKAQTFFESICRKMLSWKVVYGWMDKITKKRENTIYYEVKCINTRKTLVKDLHGAEVRYHLYCWLDVTKIKACWSGAIVTTISSIIYLSGTSATQMVG